MPKVKKYHVVNKRVGEAVLDLLVNHKHRFVTIWNRKRGDNTIRRFNGTVNSAELTGAHMRYDPSWKGIIPFKEIEPVRDSMGRFTKKTKVRFRNVAVESILKIRISNCEIRCPENMI